MGWLALELGEFWGAYAATGEFVGPPNGVADSGEDGEDEEDGGAVDEEQHEEGADHREVGGEDGGE